MPQAQHAPSSPPSVASLPPYCTVKEALSVLAKRYSCSIRTLQRYGVHKLLSSYHVGYRPGRPGIRRVPREAVAEVIRIMEDGRIPT